MRETPRLLLREMRPADLEPLLALLGDPVSMRYYPRPFDRKQVQQWIERHQGSYRQSGAGLWTMVLKATGEIIGDCGLIWQEVASYQEFEIGYHVHRDFQCQGYATEAARFFRDYAFTELNRERVISLIRPENLPSRRVAEKNHLKIIQETLWHGLRHYIYAMERAEFLKENDLDSF